MAEPSYEPGASSIATLLERLDKLTLRQLLLYGAIPGAAVGALFERLDWLSAKFFFVVALVGVVASGLGRTLRARSRITY